MKTCSNCGYKNIEEADFCCNCGVALISVETKTNKMVSIPTEVLKQQLASERVNYSESAIALIFSKSRSLKRMENVLVLFTKYHPFIKIDRNYGGRGGESPPQACLDGRAA